MRARVIIARGRCGVRTGEIAVHRIGCLGVTTTSSTATASTMLLLVPPSNSELGRIVPVFYPNRHADVPRERVLARIRHGVRTLNRNERDKKGTMPGRQRGVRIYGSDGEKQGTEYLWQLQWRVL